MEIPEFELPVDFGQDGNLDGLISRLAQEASESETFRNEMIGKARAQQELAFRDAIVSEKAEKIGKSERFFWITVNPRSEITLPELVKSVTKMYGKKWIEAYAYVYETTSNDHIHSHGLIKATYEPARARKELASSVSKICLTSNPHCFKFVILDEEKANQKLNYMLGKKQSKKAHDVEKTKKWREENDLRDIYTSEGPHTLLDPRDVPSVAATSEYTDETIL